MIGLAVAEFGRAGELLFAAEDALMHKAYVCRRNLIGEKQRIVETLIYIQDVFFKVFSDDEPRLSASADAEAVPLSNRIVH